MDEQSKIVGRLLALRNVVALAYAQSRPLAAGMDLEATALHEALKEEFRRGLDHISETLGTPTATGPLIAGYDDELNQIFHVAAHFTKIRQNGEQG